MARESAAKSSMRDRAKRRTEETTHGGGGGSVNLPEGVKWFENKGAAAELDFLPYVITDPRHPDVLAGRASVGDMTDCRIYWMHRDVGAEQKPRVCLKSIGKACPICEAHAAAKKNSSMAKEDVDALRSKERVLYNLIDLGTKDQKVQVWDVSYHLFTKMLEEEQRLNEDLYGYAELKDGYTISARFREKKMGKQEFYETSRIDGAKREAYSEDILKEVVNFDEAINILSYAQLEAIFLGTDAPADEEKEEAAAPRRAAPAPEPEPAPRRRAAAEPSPTNAPDPHRHDPDAPGARGRHAIDPDQDEPVHKRTEGVVIPKAAKPADGDCPSGHVFGKDTDTKDECDSCDVWEDCRQEKKRKTTGAVPTKSKAAAPVEPAPAEAAPARRRR